MTDTTVRRLQFAAVLLVAALAAVVSYSHIRVLALTHGGDQTAAALLPLLIDGTVAAMSFAMVRAAKDEHPVPWLARFMLILSVGATLAANTAFGAAYGVTGALLWTLPAVMFVGCVEVSVLMVRKTRPVSPPVTEPAKPAEVKPETAPAMVTVRETAPKSLTVAQQAKRAGVSQRTMYRRLAKGDMVTVNGNGKAH